MVRGTAVPYGGAYPPSSRPPRTPSRRSSLPHCGRTGRDGQVNVDWRGRLLHTTLTPFEAKGALNAAGPVRRAFRLPR